MKVNLTKQDLIDFQNKTAEDFNNGLIKAPVHLCNGNEDQLIYIFENFVGENDWICSTWRSSYHFLLKGVPPQQIRDQINNLNSIGLQFPAYNCISSAIVGGTIPIGLGIGWALKNGYKFKEKEYKNELINGNEYIKEIQEPIDIFDRQKVWIFVGDMGSLTATFSESLQYTRNFNLPVRFVVENNGKSVCTDTLKSWGLEKHPYSKGYEGFVKKVDEFIYYYEYTSKWPHAGAGSRINF